MPSHSEIEAVNGVWQQSSENTTAQETGMVVLKEWVFLCETLVPLMRKLSVKHYLRNKNLELTKCCRYGSSSTPITTLQQISASVTYQLEGWWQNLPAYMQGQNEVKMLPEVIFLQYMFSITIKITRRS